MSIGEQPACLEWPEASGADIFWNMPIEKVNDDRLGRSLNAFFEQRHSILGAVALHIAEEFQVSLSQLHYDPTHILFEGAYDNAVQRDGVISGDGIRSNATLKSFDTSIVLVHHHSPFLREVCPTRLTTRQRHILNRLNFSTPAQFFSRRLPRLPDG